MNQTLIVTDSASDVPAELEARYGIRILPFSIVVDGKSYVERKDFTPAEFYQMMLSAHDLPTHAQITPMEFVEVYRQAEEDGYQSVIYISINSHGSGTFNSARLAIDTYKEENPESKLQVYCVDSLSYTLGYGYMAVEAAKKAEKGTPAPEIVQYCEDWAKKSTIYFTPFTLEYVRKSGRVSCAAAFVGGLMGLKPLITWENGDSKTLQKLRGEKAVIPALVQMATANMVPKTDYCIVSGLRPEVAEQLAAEMEKAVGYPPALMTPASPVIAINAVEKQVFRQDNIGTACLPAVDTCSDQGIFSAVHADGKNVI